jgi:hypothetical protein
MVIYGTMEHELVYAWDMCSDELCMIIEYKCTNLWPLMFYVVRLGSDLRQDKDTPRVEQVGGFHLFIIWC